MTEVSIFLRVLVFSSKLFFACESLDFTSFSSSWSALSKETSSFNDFFASISWSFSLLRFWISELYFWLSSLYLLSKLVLAFCASLTSSLREEKLFVSSVNSSLISSLRTRTFSNSSEWRWCSLSATLMAFCFSTSKTFEASRASLICWISASNSWRADFAFSSASLIFSAAWVSAFLRALWISASSFFSFFFISTFLVLWDSFCFDNLSDSFSSDSMDPTRAWNSDSFWVRFSSLVSLFLIFSRSAEASSWLIGYLFAS